MTEERMIRVRRSEDIDWDVPFGIDGQIYIHNYKYSELELAPPKDFKPKCWHENVYRRVVYDDGDRQKIDYEEVPLCVSCDIREKCIYKRE